MPLRLARYVTKEVLPLYVLGFLLFLTLSTTDLISTIAGVMLRNNTPFATAVDLYLAYLPTIIGRVLPAAIAFAILIAFGRLAKDSELKALSAAGVRPLSLLWPLVLLGLAVAALGFYNANVLTPSANIRFNTLWYRLWTNASPAPPSEARYTYREGDALFYAGRVQPYADNPARASLSGVLIQTPGLTLSAPNGIWDANLRTWEISNYWETRPDTPPRFVPDVLRLAQQDRLRPPSNPPEQLTLAQLRERMHDDSLEVRDQRNVRFQYYRRFADPFAALGFALAAGSLGLLLRNRAWAFTSVLLIILGTYLVWSAMPQMVKVGALPEALAAWLPNVVLLVFSLPLMWRLR